MRSIAFATLLFAGVHADFGPALAHQPMPQLLPAHVKQMNTLSMRRFEPNIPQQINVVEKTDRGGDRDFTKNLKKRDGPNTNEVAGEKIGEARWGVSASLNGNRAKSAAAYADTAYPDVPARPQGVMEKNPVKTSQSFQSPEFKLAQGGAASNLLRPLAALVIGFFVGSGGTLALFYLGRGSSAASEEPLLAVLA